MAAPASRFDYFYADVAGRVRRLSAILVEGETWPGMLFLDLGDGVAMRPFRVAGLDSGAKKEACMRVAALDRLRQRRPHPQRRVGST